VIEWKPMQNLYFSANQGG